MGTICVEFSQLTDDKIGLVAAMMQMTPQEVITRIVETGLKSLDAKTVEENKDVYYAQGPTKQLCPYCGSPLKTTERRPDGNSTCTAGHTFPTKSAVAFNCTSEP